MKRIALIIAVAFTVIFASCSSETKEAEIKACCKIGRESAKTAGDSSSCHAKKDSSSCKKVCKTDSASCAKKCKKSECKKMCEDMGCTDKCTDECLKKCKEEGIDCSAKSKSKEASVDSLNSLIEEVEVVE